jgi:hypothetical protein
MAGTDLKEIARQTARTTDPWCNGKHDVMGETPKRNAAQYEDFMREGGAASRSGLKLRDFIEKARRE